MRVDVRAMAPGESAVLTVEESIVLQADEQPVDAQAAGTLRVDRTNRGVFVRGAVRALVALTCSRCLVPFQTTLGAEVEEEFALDPVAAPAGGELGAGDFVSWVGPGHEVDLTEVARQNLQMNVPMAPLHATTCRGLCLVCGANWNERTCEHIRTEGLGIRERG